MTNSAQIQEFQKRLIVGNFYLTSQSFQFCDLYGVWKWAKNCKICPYLCLLDKNIVIYSLHTSIVLNTIKY